MAKQKKKVNGKEKVLNTQQSVNAAIWSICDIMRNSNCAGALQYVPELTWMLFLRILDEREQKEAEHHKAIGIPFASSLDSPYRWYDWAAPYDVKTAAEETAAKKLQGWKRRELTEGVENAFIAFVNSELLLYLKNLRKHINATPESH
jgi:type I restriction enzyme M protein